ncbi:hypothetical protein GCM10008986_16920 [Salinibacillus aidingensis]|uniref:KTSC domain-containing protein n=1 Tax=Salinibacillus aidingensis TaxID=237684 RepID=A0ABP3L3I7_9BACI
MTWESPPFHPRYKLISTERKYNDIEILIFDFENCTYSYYFQSEVKKIRDKELQEYLFSVRRYINEDRYELSEENFYEE